MELGEEETESDMRGPWNAEVSGKTLSTSAYHDEALARGGRRGWEGGDAACESSVVHGEEGSRANGFLDAYKTSSGQPTLGSAFSVHGACFGTAYRNGS